MYFDQKKVGNQAKTKSGRDISLPLLVYVLHQLSASDILIGILGANVASSNWLTPLRI
jgi:hypothetical protein